MLFLINLGPKSSVFSPHNLAKNLTPTLLKTRKRFETMSGGSSTDTDAAISPLWEHEEVGRVKLHWKRSFYSTCGPYNAALLLFLKRSPT